MLSALLALSTLAQAATVTWTGGGTTDNWSEAANWGGTVPVTGDDLVFAGGTRLTPNNDTFAGVSFRSVTFAVGAGNFTLGGTPFTLSGGAAALINNATSGTMTITNALTFSAAAPTTTVVTGGTLVLGTINNGGLTLTMAISGTATVGGVISGNGALTKSAGGSLTLAAACAYTGATNIAAGTLRLGVTNTLQSGAGRGDVTVTGTLDLGGFALTVNGLQGAGTVTSSTVGACILTVGNNNAGPTFSGVIENGSGTVALTKIGTGTMTLSGANTYTGATTLTDGTLRVTGSLAAGSAVAVAAGKTLEGTGTVAGTVTVAGNGAISPGTGGNTFATLTTGAVTFAAATGITRVDLDGATPRNDLISSSGVVALGGSTLAINSLISGAKGRVYTIISAGSVSGTFAGLLDGAILLTNGRALRVNYTATTVTLTDIAAIWDGGGNDDNWTTAANWVDDVAPVAGDWLSFVGATRLAPSNNFPDGTVFGGLAFAAGAGDFVLSGSALTLSGGTSAITSNATSGTMTITNALTFSAVSTITTTASGALVLSNTLANGGLVTVAAGGPVTLNGVVSGAGGLTKTGTALLTLGAVNTYTGATTISAGTVRVSGSTVAASAVSVANGATLEGNGSVFGATSVANGGIIAPGLGASTIATLATANVTFVAGAITRLDLDGTTPSNDRISSSGTVALAGSTLTITSIANAIKGQVYTIVSATSVTGTFATLTTTGSILTTGGRAFRIAYTATTVTLTDITSTWDGGSPDNDFWTTPANWVGDVAPVAGDALIFAGTTRLTPSNDFAGATSFGSITFAAGAGDFVLGGSALTLSGGASAITSAATSGTMTIGNALTFSVASTITTTASGALVLGSTLANGGLVTVAAGGPVTISGAISGAGGLTKTGAATLILGGVNTYTAATTISAGTLRVTGSTVAASAVSVANGATLEGSGTVSGTITLVSGGSISPGLGGNTIATLSTANVTFVAGATHRIDLDGTVPSGDRITSTGTVALANANLVVNSATNLSRGQVYTLVSGTSVTGTFLNLANGATLIAGGRGFVIAYTATTVTLTDVASIWDGGSLVDDLWTTPANWVGDVAPVAGDALIFAGTTRLTPSNNFAGGTSFRAISFAAGAGDFVLSGNDVIVTGGLSALTSNATSGTMTVGIPLTFSTTAPTITSTAGGALVFTNTITSGALLTTVFAGGPVTMSGVLSGAGALTKTGADTLTLSAANSYNGNTTVTTGTLQMGVVNALPFGVGKGDVIVNATFNLAGFDTAINGLSGNSAVTSTTACTLTIGNGSTATTHSGVISGAVALTKVGAVIQTISGANTYSGATTISAGTLRMGNNAALPSGIGRSDVTVNGTLDLVSFSPTINGLHGSGIITTSNASARSLTLGTDNAAGAFSGVIQNGSGTVSLIKNGLGTQVLSGASTYSGTTTINGGVLRITGSLGGVGVVTIAGGTLEGTGSVVGAITLTTGSIAPGAGGATISNLSTGAVTCAAGGSLVVDLDGTGPTADRLISSGAVALNGSLTIASNSASGVGKVYTIVSGTSVTGTFAGLLDGAQVAGGGRAFVVNYTATTVTLTDAPYEWDGGGTDDLWSTADNWVGNAVPPAGAFLVFSGNARLMPDNDLTGVPFAGVSFSGSAGNFTLIGDPITLSGGSSAVISAATSGTMTIDAPLIFTTAAPTITTAAGGSLVLSQVIDNGGMTLTVANAGPVTLGRVTGIGSVAKVAGGVLTLSGMATTTASNFTGDLIIDAGTVAVASDTALSGTLYFGGAAGSVTIATLDVSAGNLTTGALIARTNSASSNLITIGGGRTLTTTGSVTIGNAVSATNTALTVSGAGTWAVNAPGGVFSLGGYTPAVTNFSNQASLDLSGLATFTCDVTTGSVLLGRFGDNLTRVGTMTLATNSTISAATLTIGESASASLTSLLMGSGATVFQVETLNIGTGGRDSGSLSFAGGTGTLHLRNRAGTGRANVNVQTGGGTTTGYQATNTIDLSGHAADLLINDLIVGGQGRIGSATNTITFTSGTLDVTTLRLGERSNNQTTANPHVSTLNLGGGTVTIGVGGLQMATNASTGPTANVLNATVNLSGGTVTIANNATIGAAIRVAHNPAAGGATTANGVLNITGGSLAVAGDIILGATTRPATAAVTLAGGTLNVGGNDIGSATSTVTLTAQSGSLSNLTELNGGGAFTKTTAGTLTLGGLNTWSGASNLSTGTVLLGSSTALPSGTGKGDVTLGAVLDLAGFNAAVNGLTGNGTVTSSVAAASSLVIGLNDVSSTFGGVIQNGSGTVSVQKAGTGTLVLTNAHTYSGTTSVLLGTLRVSGSTSAASAVTLSNATLEGAGTVAGTVGLSDGVVAPGNGGNAIGTLTTGAATFASSMNLVLNLDGSAPLGERVLSTGAVALNGGLMVASLNNAALGTVYTIVSAASVTGTFTGLADNATFAGGGHAFRINYGATAVTLTEIGGVWDGGGTDNLWSTAANWEGDAVPVAGSHLVFAGTTRLSPDNDLTGEVFSSLSFAQGAGNFTIEGDAITLSGGGTTLGNGATSGTMTIDAPVIFITAAPTIVTLAGGTLVLSDTVDNGGLTLTTANEGPVTISGALIGSGGLIKGGTGALTMSGAGTYSGGTLVHRGDVVLASSGGAVTGPVGTGTVTIDSGLNAARVLLNGGQTVSNALVMTSIAPGSTLGALQYNGTGLATWSGSITLNANATTGGHVVGGSSATNALVVSGVLTSGGSLTRMTQRLGFVIYAGIPGTLPELAISGTAHWGVSDPLPAGVQLFLAASSLTTETGVVDLNGFNQTVGGLTFQNMAGGIITTGAGTLTLGGDIAATFAGTLDANVNTIAGNLDLGGVTRTITVADSAAANDVTISAVIANGALTKTGAGVLAFTGTAANTYNGTTTVSAGTLLLSRTAGVDAIAGDLAITGGKVTFGANHQIADTATVTMSGTTSVFNGTGVNAGGLADFTETIAALTVTGGAFNCGASGSAPVITVTGATSFTGGGNTIFVGQSGTTFTTGSLALTNMTATAGGTIATNSSFTLYGSHPVVISKLTIGAGGLSLTGASRLNLRRGAAGQQGSRLVLNGDVTANTGTSQIIEDNNAGTVGTISLELSSTAGAAVRTVTVTTGSTLDINLPIINGTATPGGLIKEGAGQLTLGGGTLANTYLGVTTVNAGRLHLNKSAAVVAIVGNLVIAGGQVSLPNNVPSNQIADTATVTMSGTTSVFNGTVGVNQNAGNVTETIANLIVTGGNFNAGGTSIWTITGALSMTGGGNTIFVGNSGTRLFVGSLSLSAMTATAGATIGTNNSFTMYGAQTTQSVLTVGAGGLSLDGSVLNLRRGGAGQLGSKLVLNGDVVTSGTVASTIREDASGGTTGSIAVELSGIAGATTRTITTAAGGANLTISIPIVDGAATPGSLVKTGTGSLTTTATNTWSGTTTVSQGSLFLVGTQATTAVTVGVAGTLGGSGTIAGTMAVSGTLALGSGGTTIGQLSSGATTWNTGGAMMVDLNGTGLAADRLTTTGQALALDGPLTVSSMINDTPGQVFTILSAATISGIFTGAPEGTVIPAGSTGRAVSVSYATPGVVTLTALTPPTVTAIVPNNGPTTTQMPVTITGTLFDPAATVTIGGVSATSVVWVNSTTITAVTPTGTQGLADVVVTNPDTQRGTLMGGYAYTGAAPTVTSLSPAFGPALSTTVVTITGTNFLPGSAVAVSVGGIAATAVTYVNDTTLMATFPVMSALSSDVTPDVVVTNGDRQQGTLANGFTYVMRTPENPTGTQAGLAYRYHRVGGPLIPAFDTLVPYYEGNYANATLTGINPFEARNDNWSTELTGYVTVPDDGIYTFFTASDDGSRLYIGSTLVVNNNFAQGVTERSGQIALTAGAHQVRVEFAQGNGGWGLFTSWQGPTVAKEYIPDLAFTCDPTPVITTITPASGPQGGGTDIVIAGSGFVPGSVVVIGGTLAVAPAVLDGNTLSVTTPGGPVGAQDVVVIGPRSPGITLVGGFTYLTSAAPTLTVIAPPNGTVFGGTPVTLTVSNIGVTPTVTFNGVPATSVVWVNATTVTCVTPVMPLDDATADVTVTAGGLSATLANGFTWDGLRVAENPTGTQDGLAYNYYHSGGPTLPTFSALTPFSTGTTGITAPFGWTSNPIELGYNANFSLRWLGYLTVPADGIYRLFTESDDASRLYVGSTLVVDNNFAQGLGAASERSGQMALAAGTHLLTVEYAQGGGGFGMYVRWQGPNLAKVEIPASAFTTDPTPTITTLDVITGPQSGGTAVVITGSGFTSAVTVTFGGTPAINVAVSNGGTTIQCLTPSHAVGPVAVTVTNLTGTTATAADPFTYTASAGPTIASITPPTGPAGGGTLVTILGDNFGAPMTVTIGGQAATNVQVLDVNTLTAETPTMSSATLVVDVTVTNGAAQSATLVGGFTYSLRVPENPTNIEAGLTYRYHRVAGPLLPTFTGLTPYAIAVRSNATIVVGNPGAANPFDATINEYWSVEYRGYITVPTDGIYTFFTESDDGSQLLLGNGVVVANNFAQGMTERSGSIGLLAGTHQLRIRFAQGSGNFGLNVRWQGPSIAKALIPDNILWTDARPTFTLATPNAGTNAGGNTITITGTGFTSGTTVTIGGTAATGVLVAPDGMSLTAVVPAHAAGLVPIVIANGNGLAVTQPNAYLYQGAAPTITAVSPLGGPMAGGATVFIYGTNFTAGATVTIGGALATNVVVGSGVISATTPAGARGPAVVTVLNVDTQSASRSPGYYFQGPTPTITSLSFTRGPLAGGTTLTVTGTGFFAGATATFDGVAATGVTVVNATTIILTTPANAQGPSNLVVSNIDLLSGTRTNAFIFEGPAPTITSIAPTSGLMAGGTTVTISGTNFVGASVTFGGVNAAVVSQTGTSITVTTPAGAQGFTDVVVSNIDLLTATLTNGYIFLGAPPVITGINPMGVPNNLATPITISGTGFVPGILVTIGGVPATVTSVTGTAVIVTMPGGLPPGPADVVVTNIDLQTVVFTGFVAQGPAPILTGIDVPYGPVAGGRRMTLTGSAFRAGAIVTVGGIPATVLSITPTTIVVLTPAHGEGAVTVTVTNDDLLSSSLVNAYSYYTRNDNSTAGNGCGTGGGLAVFLLLGLWMFSGGFANRRR